MRKPLYGDAGGVIIKVLLLAVILMVIVGFIIPKGSGAITSALQGISNATENLPFISKPSESPIPDSPEAQTREYSTVWAVALVLESARGGTAHLRKHILSVKSAGTTMKVTVPTAMTITVGTDGTEIDSEDSSLADGYCVSLPLPKDKVITMTSNVTYPQVGVSGC